MLEKNQLARRVQTGLSESQVVSTIVGLMREEYRTHVRLQHPTTFLDLRRIAVVLDVSTSVKPEMQYKSQQPAKVKYSDPGKTSSAPVGKTNTAPNLLRKPPHPCRYCKGSHWNNECPKIPAGNGPKPDRA